MLDPIRLEEAIDLQRRSYALLKWLADAIPRGFISFDTAHEYTDSAESALAWISEHFDNLPRTARPISCDAETMKRFANFFASYIDTSFDLEENPGTRLQSGCSCYCPFCTVVVSAPHLRTKRLGRPHKERAKKLEHECLKNLAASKGLSLDADVFAELLLDHGTREQAALVAYVGQLFRRLDGTYTGPWVLALWRTFAWHQTGSPKHGFELTPELVLEAERALVNKLSTVAA